MRLEQIPPSTIRYSQRTAGGNGRAARLRLSLANGWNGPPINAVRTVDGITTLDNTRVVIACELGLEAIPVNVWTPFEPLPESMVGRFGDALTWGQALAHRLSNQRPRLGPTGTASRPILPEEFRS